MNDSEIRFLGDLQRLVLRPGDQFVLTVSRPISMETAARIRQAWNEFVGGYDDKIRLLIIQEGMKLGVINLTPSEPPDRDHMLNG